MSTTGAKITPDQRLAAVPGRHVKLAQYFHAMAAASAADLAALHLRLAAHYERLAKDGFPSDASTQPAKHPPGRMGCSGTGTAGQTDHRMRPTLGGVCAV